MEVMSPVSKGVQMYNMNRLLVFMYREFRALQKRGLVPAIRANELSAQFANVAEVSLRKRLKLFCDFQVNGWLFYLLHISLAVSTLNKLSLQTNWI